jgi:hypothetical protein
MMQYRSGLVGKHFKTLMQVSSFHLKDITSAEQLSLSCAIGELGALLWVAEIEDLESYLVRTPGRSRKLPFRSLATQSVDRCV